MLCFIFIIYLLIYCFLHYSMYLHLLLYWSYKNINIYIYIYIYIYIIINNNSNINNPCFISPIYSINCINNIIIINMSIIIIKDRKNILKMNKEVRMLLPKKDLIQVE